MHAISLTPIAQGDTVAVIGAGVIGLMVDASLVDSACAHIVVSDISDERLELVRACGATHTVNPTKSSLMRICYDLTEGRGADSVIEAVGHQQTILDAIAAVRRGATVTLVGNLSKQVNIPLQKIVAGQIRFQGSCAIREEFPAALALLNSGKIPLELIISATGTLEEAPQLFERLMKKDSLLIKVILHPQD